MGCDSGIGGQGRENGLEVDGDGVAYKQKADSFALLLVRIQPDGCGVSPDQHELTRSDSGHAKGNFPKNSGLAVTEAILKIT